MLQKYMFAESLVAKWREIIMDMTRKLPMCMRSLGIVANRAGH